MRTISGIISITFLVTLSISGCGYTFQGSGSVLPDDIKSISISRVENETTSSGLAAKFEEKLMSRFERYGVVKIVSAGEDADARLITKIKSLVTNVRETTGDDIALELEASLVIDAELRRRNGQLLYKNPSLLVADTYGSVGDVVVTSSADFAQSGIGAGTLGTLGEREVSRGQEEQTLDSLLEEAARKLYLDAVAAEF
jgi:hypothetical protein